MDSWKKDYFGHQYNECWDCPHPFPAQEGLESRVDDKCVEDKFEETTRAEF